VVIVADAKEGKNEDMKTKVESMGNIRHYTAIGAEGESQAGVEGE